MTVKEIKEIGFRFAADCKLSPFEKRFSIDIVPEFRNGADKLVYAICVDDEVAYVGQTDRGLRRRFTGYRNNEKDHDKGIGINIKRALEKSGVRVFVWMDKDPFELGRFCIDRFLSVEYAIRHRVFLPWNRI